MSNRQIKKLIFYILFLNYSLIVGRNSKLLHFWVCVQDTYSFVCVFLAGALIKQYLRGPLMTVPCESMSPPYYGDPKTLHPSKNKKKKNSPSPTSRLSGPVGHLTQGIFRLNCTSPGVIKSRDHIIGQKHFALTKQH